tara:strand:+ start:244 stop:735 length:492 start_codon:yes stop_codon:yes gene_type:complete
MTYTPARVQNYQTVADTSVSAELISTTLKIYDGTEIEYTPAAGAEKVVYHVNYNAWNGDPEDEDVTFMNTRLQESTDNGVTWSDIDGCKLFEGTSSPIYDYDFIPCTHTFMIGSWSGTRKLRLAGRSKDTDSEYQINQLYIGGSYVGNSACPSVSVFSLMKAE